VATTVGVRVACVIHSLDVLARRTLVPMAGVFVVHVSVMQVVDVVLVIDSYVAAVGIVRVDVLGMNFVGDRHDRLPY
jgi:hypothetical protein